MSVRYVRVTQQTKQWATVNVNTGLTLTFFLMLWPWPSLLSAQTTAFPENICSLLCIFVFQASFCSRIARLLSYYNDFLESPGLWMLCTGLWSSTQTSSQWAIWLVRHWLLNTLKLSLNTIVEGLCVYNILKVYEQVYFNSDFSEPTFHKCWH